MAGKKEENVEITLFGEEGNKNILEKILKSKARIKLKNFRVLADDAEIIFPSFNVQKALLEKSTDKEKAMLEQLAKGGGAITIEDFEASGEEIEIILPSFAQQIIIAGFGGRMQDPELAKAIEKLKMIEKMFGGFSAEVKATEKPPEFKFDTSKITEKYSMQISEVTLGATRTEGGSRNASVKIGGQRTMPFYFFEGSFVNKPVVSNDVFDIPEGVPKVVRERFKMGNKTDKEIMADVGEWARFRVEKSNAKVVTLHLISTDPNGKNASVQDAMKTIAHVLQSVKVPIVVGGSGNPVKDPLIFKEAAEMFAGERLLFSTISRDMKYEDVVKACIKYEHNLGTLVSMNPDDMRRLNTGILKAGLPRNQLLMDPFTAGIGYGIEYSISSLERCRLGGLFGEESLAVPIISATSNVWAAKEAWKKNDEWGPREFRGPLYESATGLVALLCGADILYSLDVLAIELLNKIIDSAYELREEKRENGHLSWINA